MATHSSILAWRILRTEEPGETAVPGVAESDTTARLSTHAARETLTYRALPTSRSLSTGHCQLLMTSHCAHLQGSGHLQVLLQNF